MNERVRFVAAMLEAEEMFGGIEALVDRPRAPHSHPHAVSAEVVQLLVTARKKHPRWDPRKLRSAAAR